MKYNATKFHGIPSATTIFFAQMKWCIHKLVFKYALQTNFQSTPKPFNTNKWSLNLVNGLWNWFLMLSQFQIENFHLRQPCWINKYWCILKSQNTKQKLNQNSVLCWTFIPISRYQEFILPPGHKNSTRDQCFEQSRRHFQSARVAHLWKLKALSV